jgi:ferredoxin
VEAEKPVQGRIAHHKITANQQCQIRTNKRNRREQIHDHLSTPIAHLSPGQQIAHEGFCHQCQENTTSKQPNQLTRFAVTTVHQATEHVQINHNKKCRGTCRVHVTNQPTPRDITHDVLHRSKRQGGVRLVMHHQENSGDDLDHKHQERQGSKDVPEVEVLWSVILTHVLLEELGQRKPVVDPVECFFAQWGVGGDFVKFSHVVRP